MPAMTDISHTLIKPEKFVQGAVGMLEQELVVPNLFNRAGFDDYRGAKNDTITIRVPGTLPFRQYEFRNDRSNPIVFDEYAETTVTLTVGDNVYSAVRITDEHRDFDLDGNWGNLLAAQTKAVARGLARDAIKTMVDQTYNVTIGGAEANLLGAITEARRVLNRFMVPDEQRFLVCGTDFETALLNDTDITFSTTEGRAESALAEATIGRVRGFTVIVAQELPPSKAYAMVPSAFNMLTAAPSVPQSVAFGSTTSFEGLALRWIQDYDPDYMVDRSVVNTWCGFQETEDILVRWEAPEVGDTDRGQEKVSTGKHFVRAIELTLDGTSTYPAAASELATFTGISDAAEWTPGGGS